MGCVGEAATYMLTYRPPRPDFWKTLTAAERETVEAHFNYLAELHEKGIVQFAGRSDDATFGVVILTAASLEEAERYMRESPAYIKGMYSGEAKPCNFAPK